MAAVYCSVTQMAENSCFSTRRTEEREELYMQFHLHGPYHFVESATVSYMLLCVCYITNLSDTKDITSYGAEDFYQSMVCSFVGMLCPSGSIVFDHYCTKGGWLSKNTFAVSHS